MTDINCVGMANRIAFIENITLMFNKNDAFFYYYTFMFIFYVKEV